MRSIAFLGHLRILVDSSGFCHCYPQPSIGSEQTASLKLTAIPCLEPFRGYTCNTQISKLHPNACRWLRAGHACSLQTRLRPFSSSKFHTPRVYIVPDLIWERECKCTRLGRWDQERALLHLYDIFGETKQKNTGTPPEEVR